MPQTTARCTALRRIAASLCVGLLVTLLIAWPVPLALLRLKWNRHDLGAFRPWTTPEGLHCGVSSSRLWFSDAFSVRTVTTRDSVLPLSEPARVPTWVARPPGGEKRPVRVDTGATGWPRRALGSESWQVLDPPVGGTWHEELRWNLVLHSGKSGRIMLPFRPLWVGLVADIAIYAAAWWSFIFGLASVRGQLRRRRGLCPRCAYNLSATPTNEPCPECGTKSRRRGVHA